MRDHFYQASGLPKHELPAESLPKEVAHRLISEALVLDGTPQLNLASFVTTQCDKEAEDLMRVNAKKNAIDMDEYPQIWKTQQRCVNIISRLFHAPLSDGQDGTGTAAVGSSEAIMLATLAMKWKWKERCKRLGKPATSPNIVFGSNVQVCWHKACKYFEIEGREAPVSPDCLVLTAERAKPLIDENTIGVCPILGSTFNGEFENVKEIHDMVQELNKANGWNIPIHVDAASGGFVAPFTMPQLVWDFRLPGVKSINVSGHKFGLVYAGIGWVVFREETDLHDDLVFRVNYLGGDQASFTLNFSKGSGTIVGQYYNFVRLGREGYAEVMKNCMSNAQYLRVALNKTQLFTMHDKGHLPLLAFSLLDDSKYTVFDLQDKLRNRGWIVPAYTCSEGATDLAIMRIVVKENFSRDLADMLLEDIKEAIAWLDQHITRLKLEEKDKVPAAKKRKVKETEAQAPTREVHHLGHDPSHRLSGIRTHSVC